MPLDTSKYRPTSARHAPRTLLLYPPAGMAATPGSVRYPEEVPCMVNLLWKVVESLNFLWKSVLPVFQSNIFCYVILLIFKLNIQDIHPTLTESTHCQRSHILSKFGEKTIHGNQDLYRTSHTLWLLVSRENPMDSQSQNGCFKKNPSQELSPILNDASPYNGNINTWDMIHNKYDSWHQTLPTRFSKPQNDLCFFHIQHINSFPPDFSTLDFSSSATDFLRSPVRAWPMGSDGTS